MPVFCPPVVQDWPQVLEYDPEKRANPLGYRLMRYYPSRFRGVNVFKMSDGTYARDDRPRASRTRPPISRSTG